MYWSKFLKHSLSLDSNHVFQHFRLPAGKKSSSAKAHKPSLGSLKKSPGSSTSIHSDYGAEKSEGKKLPLGSGRYSLHLVFIC